MPRIAVAMPTKMTAKRIRYAIATPARPWSRAALRIVSSLRNGPNGGEPVIAKRPIAQSIPDAGRARRTPRTSSGDLERYLVRMFPATRNIIALVKERSEERRVGKEWRARRWG